MAARSLHKLLEDARNGDTEALGALLEHYRSQLRQLAQQQLDSQLIKRVDASDVVQQTCLEACRDFPDFCGASEEQLIAWLQQILRNNVAELVQRHMRTQKRNVKREQCLYPDGDQAASLLAVLAGDTSTPSHKAVRAEQEKSLLEAIHALPGYQRRAIELRYLDGESLEQIGTQLTRSESAVAGLLARGLRKLRQQLADSLHSGQGP